MTPYDEQDRKDAGAVCPASDAPAVVAADEPLPQLPTLPSVDITEQDVAPADPVFMDVDFEIDLSLVEVPQSVESETPVVDNLSSWTAESGMEASPGLVMPVVYAESSPYERTVPAVNVEGWRKHRVLIVSHDLGERMYLRTKLALSHLVWVDEVASTASALNALEARSYMIAIVNMDSLAIDGYSVAKRFLQANAQGVLALTTTAFSGAHPLNLLACWRRRQLRAHMGALQHTTVMSKPLNPREISDWLSRFLIAHPG